LQTLQTVKIQNPDDEDLRDNEKLIFEEGDYESIINIKYEVDLDAVLNIAKTVFVCIVLLCGALYFTKDANDLVIIPIEKMTDKVRRMAKNPIAA